LAANVPFCSFENKEAIVIGISRVAVGLTILLGLAAGAFAQKAITPADSAAIIKAMDNAMDPGEGQKKLEFLVGTFDVKIRTWVQPSQPPIESLAVAVSSWVLGNRYVQTIISGFVLGDPFNAIGYAGYDNLAKHYVACYMDSGSTGMEWYTGSMDPAAKSAVLNATILDALTLKPVKLEMRLRIAVSGDHITELWRQDPGSKMEKVIELQYTRKKL
jgi:hypothetical protein